MHIRNPYILSHLPFGELINDVNLCLSHFSHDMERLYRQYEKLLKEGRASEKYILSIVDRLGRYQNQYEFTTELVSKVTTFDSMHVLQALEDAKAYAGNSNVYGFGIHFNYTNPPELIIH